jgi:hypothetical protein
VIVSYGFFYPQLFLGRTIRASRDRQLEIIQAAMRPYLQRMAALTEEEQKRLSALIDLQSRLMSAKQSAIDPKTIGTYLTSLIIPIASFLLGRLGFLPQKSP